MSLHPLIIYHLAPSLLNELAFNAGNSVIYIMKTLRQLLAGSTFWGICALAVATTQSAQASTILFDNLTTPAGTFSIDGAGQIGDEVILADSGNGATITSFSFELYYANVAPGATFTVGFYANNGPASSAGPLDPGTLLWSGTGNLVGGSSSDQLVNFGLAALGGGVTVPHDFTWAISFSGLGSAAGEDAGLILSTALGPSIGGDYNDYWLNTGSVAIPNWNPALGSPSTPDINFLAEFDGTPTPDQSSSLALLSMGVVGLLVLKRFRPVLASDRCVC